MLPIEISTEERLFSAGAGSLGLSLKFRSRIIGQPLAEFVESQLVKRIIG